MSVSAWAAAIRSRSCRRRFTAPGALPIVKNATAVQASRINGRTHSSMIRAPKQEAIWGRAGESSLADKADQSPFPDIHRPIFFERFWEPKGVSGCDAGRRTSTLADWLIAPGHVAQIRGTGTQESRAPAAEMFLRQLLQTPMRAAPDYGATSSESLAVVSGLHS
jgi:hypothetical protein